MRRLRERSDKIVAIVEKNERRISIRSVDKKDRRRMSLPLNVDQNLKHGDIIVAHLEGVKISGKLQVTLHKVLGRIGQPHSIEAIVCADNDIPVEFAPEIEKEALLAGPPNRDGRVDLTSIPFVTIDDEDARDFDDAVWAEPDTSRGNPDGWKLIIAIADVSSYVPSGSALDKEAQKRGNSVYLPSKVIPMLPHSLSNEWCSLKPNQVRACITAHVSINNEGRIKHYKFERAIMRSVARLSYKEVDAYRDKKTTVIDKSLEVQIDSLYGAYASLRKARLQRKTLDFDLPEKKIIFDNSGKVTAIENQQRYDSHRLIEEFMITANVAAAEVLTKRTAPCMYRVHDQPPLDKTENLRSYLKTLNYKLSKSQQLRPQHFQQILEKSQNTEHGEAVALMILRSQSQAEYTPVNIGHFGLNIDRYSHFTSPIRRYSDLLVHRSLITTLKLGDGGLPKAIAIDFPAIGTHLSQTERRATSAERNAMDRYQRKLRNQFKDATQC